MLSIRDLVFKERLVKKLTEKYIEPYIVEKVVSKNMVKLKLLASMRIHLVVNISRVVRYREPVKEQKVEEPKPVKVDRVKEWEIKKILNKRKSMRSNEVFSVLEGIYCRKQYMGEEGRLRKCERVSR